MSAPGGDGLAVVVLAHGDPEHANRLLAALDPLPVFLHVDAKSPDDLPALMARGAEDRVVVVPRRRTDLSSWSLVAAEVEAVELALARSDAEHVAVLSGADYPLLPVPELLQELRLRPGTRMKNSPLPLQEWNTPRNRDGGLWRLRSRFATHRDRVLYLGPVPLRWPWRRSLPRGVVARGGSQWKVYSRRDAQTVVDVASSRPDLVRFWRSTLVPDETFVSSVLGSPEVTGRPSIVPTDDSAWFIQWPTGGYHPLTLDETAMPVIEAEVARRRAAAEAPMLFARKTSSERSGRLLGLIDERLRAQPSARS